jgi:hypothetical protein
LEDVARLGSRKAFSKLKEIAVRRDSFGTMAKRRVALLEKELLIFRSVPGFYSGLTITQDGKKQSVDELPTSELFLHLEGPSIAKEHIPAMMAHIAKKPKNEVYLYAKRILESSDSLPACAATCGILSKMVGEKAPFLAFDDWSKVCQQELDNIE